MQEIKGEIIMETITEDYCSKEIYRLLIEKGFDGEIHTSYDEEGYTQASITLQMAMKWIRKMHNINIEIFVIKYYDKKICKYTYTIMDLNFPGSDDGIDCGNKYKTYEKACEAAIKYCLENLI